MLSRALRLATVMLLIGCFEAALARAQAQNLEAGKSPSQIFAGTCSACHKSARGLLKTVAPGSLPAFLRQHYTTSSDMASLLSSFLISNGATDTRYVGTQGKPGKDAKPEAKPAEPAEYLDRFGRRMRPPQDVPKPDAEPRQAAKPDADGPAQAEPGRHGRNAKRLARPGDAPDVAKPAVDGQTPAQAASERGPDGRKSTAKQRLGKRDKPGSEESPKTDAAKGETELDKIEAAKIEAARTEAAKTEAAKTDAAKSDPARTDATREEPAKAESGKDEKPPSEAAKIDVPRIEQPKDPPKETGSREAPVTRADPVPPVTPAPPPAAASGGTPEPPAAPPRSAMTESVPPPAPIAPAGPPAPPISQ